MPVQPTVAAFQPPVAACDQTPFHHPLELFPIFRRIRPSIGRDLVYTFIWSTMIGAVFALLSFTFDPPRSLSAFDWGRFAWSIFVISNCIGFLMHVEFMIGDRLVPGIHRSRLAARALYYSILPIFAVMGGWWLGEQILHRESGRIVALTPATMISICGVSLLMTGILLAIFIPRERAANAQAAIERERARVAAAEREATLARLKMLEAQIEPHFLYNTLATAISLVDNDPTAAKRMLDRLISLLRAAADNDDPVTLGRQAELVGAYLDILALRMGSRLQWSIDIAPDAAALPVPPMLLQPIVENAVKHGLEPKLEGGRVDIEARRNGTRIELTVTDTGLGFGIATATQSTGVGLRNLRARLGALYGDAATLAIEERSPSGTRVALSIPANAR